MCQQKFLDHQNQKNPSPLSSDELSPPLNQQSPNQIMVSEIRSFQKKILTQPRPNCVDEKNHANPKIQIDRPPNLPSQPISDSEVGLARATYVGSKYYAGLEGLSETLNLATILDFRSKTTGMKEPNAYQTLCKYVPMCPLMFKGSDTQCFLQF